MADLSDIPDEAVEAPAVEPTTPGPLPGVTEATNAKLDAIEVDLRGGYTLSGEQIAEDPDEFRDERYVNVADLPSIIHAWASAALPVLNTAKDSGTATWIDVVIARLTAVGGPDMTGAVATLRFLAASLRGE